jgi:drug/metabolite transporter (DMT)-like permease
MRSANLKAIAIMLPAVALFSVMDASLKHLSTSYSAAEVSFLRGAASLPFLLLPVVWRGRWGDLRMTAPLFHLLRAVLGVMMLLSFIYAVSLQSLSKVYAIFMSAPLMVAALSHFLLGVSRASIWRG